MGFKGMDGVVEIDGVAVHPIQEWALDRDVAAMGGFGEEYDVLPPPASTMRLEWEGQFTVAGLRELIAQLTAYTNALERPAPTRRLTEQDAAEQAQAYIAAAIRLLNQGTAYRDHASLVSDGVGTIGRGLRMVERHYGLTHWRTQLGIESEHDE